MYYKTYKYFLTFSCVCDNNICESKINQIWQISAVKLSTVYWCITTIAIILCKNEHAKQKKIVIGIGGGFGTYIG